MQKKTKITIVLAALLVAVLALAAVLWQGMRPKTAEGDKDITFTVVYKDAQSRVFEINTDEQYLANALADEGIIAYDASGLYTTINGVTADYSADGSWWCINENGQMASVGMNELPIADGGAYEAIYKTGSAA